MGVLIGSENPSGKNSPPNEWWRAPKKRRSRTTNPASPPKEEPEEITEEESEEEELEPRRQLIRPRPSREQTQLPTPRRPPGSSYVSNYATKPASKGEPNYKLHVLFALTTSIVLVFAAGGKTVKQVVTGK